MSLYEDLSSTDKEESGDTAAFLEVLGLKPGASDAEIKAAYRRMATEYHPDKHAGVPASLRKLAEEKFKEIQNAYERLSKKVSPVDHSSLHILDRNGTETVLSAASKGDVVCCWHCQQKNRMPEEHQFSKARCGNCRGLLATDLTKGRFVKRFMAPNLKQ